MSAIDCQLHKHARRLVLALAFSVVAPAWSAESPPPHRIDRLPRPQAGGALDLGEVARGYEAAGVGAMPHAGAPRLLVFVSLAMPDGSLRRLAADAPRAGAVLVLRGLHEGSMARTAARIRQLGGGKTAIQVDPKAFARFGIEQVPTMVLAREAAAVSACQERGCAAPGDFVSVAGDVTLDYALEHIARATPRFAAQARRLRGRGAP